MTKSSDHTPNIFFSKVGKHKLRTAIWKGVGKTKRTPILFFNGIGANLEVVQNLAIGFKDRDVITFDLPGIGRSPSRKLPYRPSWVAKVAKQILIENGYSKVDVMGVSWGGGAAQQFAWQNKELTNNLILCATSTGCTMIPGNPLTLTKMISPRRFKDAQFRKKNFGTLYGEVTDAGSGEFTGSITPPSIRGYLYQLSAIIGWSSIPFIWRIKVPMLILAGQNDPIVPPINSRFLNLLAKDSRLQIIPNSGHLFLLTRRDETTAVIKKFVDGHRKNSVKSDVGTILAT